MAEATEEVEEEEEQECPKCPPPGAPAWMATFADMATLLMAFFVLILSFAEFNVPKFKQISGSLKNAFGVQRIVPVVEQPKGTTVLSLNFSPSPSPSVTKQMTQQTTTITDSVIDKSRPSLTHLLNTNTTIYFKENGLKVEIIEPADPNDPPKQVAAGKIDIAISYQPQFHLQIDQSLPIVRLGSLVSTPLNSLVVLKDGPIKSIKDLKNKIINYVDEKFKGNENFKKIIETSAFCSEDNNIVPDSYKITRDQKIGIIPPIGGG